MVMTPPVRLTDILFLYSEFSHGFEETAVPYAEFKKAGFEIDFVTEKGNMPECDAKMLTGMTQKLLVRHLNFPEARAVSNDFASSSTGCY